MEQSLQTADGDRNQSTHNNMVCHRELVAGFTLNRFHIRTSVGRRRYYTHIQWDRCGKDQEDWGGFGVRREWSDGAAGTHEWPALVMEAKVF